MKDKRTKIYDRNSIPNILRHEQEFSASFEAEKEEKKQAHGDESSTLQEKNLKPSELMEKKKKLSKTQLKELRDLSIQYAEISEKLFDDPNNENHENHEKPKR